MHINKNLDDFKDTFIDLVKKIYKQNDFQVKQFRSQSCEKIIIW